MRHRRFVPSSRMRHGTTVLELVVALVITGAVAAAGAAAFRQSIDRRTQLLGSSTATERASALRAQLREWVSSGTVTWPAATDGLRFTTTAPIAGVAAGSELLLYVDGDPSTDAEGLSVQFRPTPDAPVQVVEIDASIDSMRVEYFDFERRTWVSASQASATRPLAVRITLPESAPTNTLRSLPVTVVLTGNRDAVPLDASAAEVRP